ncbi:choice-of-anchor D domain-containing protein [uncultured Lutibacter sp.]|uniref:choice-of-anchor D domain-containing protein n=1 Tax=uncultured Lutibacter sp. TaxID=437739 RepID=UPI002627B689|nr:choice-of-anchor D domain-containing protein [uncultured Lutibacter sp.]
MIKKLLLSILFISFFSVNVSAQGTLDVTGSVNYGNVNVDSSLSNTFVLDNTGGNGSPNSLNGITVSISGANSSEFVPNTTSLGDLTGNGGTLNLDINFTPTGPGLRTATVTITFSNGTNSPYTFNIQGTGIVPQPEIYLSGNGVEILNGETAISLGDDRDYGLVDIGISADHIFTIENTVAGSTLLLDGSPNIVAITGNAAFTIETQPSANSISGINSLTFVVRFTPTTTNPVTATISIDNSDSDEDPYTFSVQGTGRTPQPEIYVTGNGVEIADGETATSLGDHTSFGDVNNGGSLTRTYTVKNTGSLNLTIGENVSLTNDTEFKVTTQPGPTTLAPNETTTFSITFTPSSVTSFSDVVSLSNNDSDEGPDYTFNISGNGINEDPNYIAFGSNWDYYDSSNEPADDLQGDSWEEADFDSSGWSNGPGELGYGNDGEGSGTLINSATEAAYFRKTFTVTDASLYNDLVLEAYRDDGMVVYINGVEVWSNNMPTTRPTSYGLFANATVATADENTPITTTVGSNLVNGINTVAVEVHQVNNTSSDIRFDFKLTAYEAVPVVIERGPYLQKGTPTSVVIKWRTNTSTESVVNYGTMAGALTNNFTDNTKVINHEIEITGLTSNTKYFYDIADADGTLVAGTTEMYVITSPPHGTKQFVRIWALGDPGTEGNGTYPGDQFSVRDAYYDYVNNTNSPPVAASSNIGQTDMMLFLGDNAYNSGTDTEYQNGLFNVYDDILPKTVAWSTRGNHETVAGTYYEIFAHPTAGEAGGIPSGTEEYYSFDYANIHFIVLESYQLENDTFEDAGNPVLESQLEWLKADIAATTQDWIIAFFHHPPYTKGSHDSDTESDLIAMRNNFAPVLEAGGVDVILNGHSHSYERSFFINGRTTNVNGDLLNSGASGAGKTVGVNGGLDGQIGSGGAYARNLANPNEGAVYIVTGSAGKATTADWQSPGGVYNTITGDHAAMYFSLLELGSTIIEIDDDGSGGQNLNMKFLRETGTIDDFFTINKSSSEISLSTETYEVDNKLIKLYPVPANSFMNIEINTDEKLKQVEFYNVLGSLVKVSNQQQMNVRGLKTGMYLVQIITDKNRYYKSVIIE